MERKQQQSRIRFIGTGTTRDIDNAQWKLENRNKHLKHQQALLNQIHLKRKIKDQEASKKSIFFNWFIFICFFLSKYFQN